MEYQLYCGQRKEYTVEPCYSKPMNCGHLTIMAKSSGTD